MKKLLSLLLAVILLSALCLPALAEETLFIDEESILIEEEVPDEDGAYYGTAPQFTLYGPEGSFGTSDIGKGVLLIFGRGTCSNTRALLGELRGRAAAIRAKGISVVADLIDAETPQDLAAMQSVFPDIRFMYGNDILWDLLDAAGYASFSVTFPAVFVIDRNLSIVHFSTGYVYDVDELLRALDSLESSAPVPTPVPGATVGLNVAYRTPEDIRRFDEANPFFAVVDTEYDAEPSAVIPYELGMLSSSTRTPALNCLNFVRYVAGLQADVTEDAEYTRLAQAAALINEINMFDPPSHNPPRPYGMDDELYALACEGAGASNLAMGYGYLPATVFYGWTADPGVSNQYTQGHRRWILNPKMGRTGFGMVGDYNAMYAFDESRSNASESLVAWPAQTMPSFLFGSGDCWTLSVGRRLKPERIQVTLTRLADGRKWEFSEQASDGFFAISNESYGQPGCIIFRPSGIDGYKPGDEYSVRVTGALTETIEYTVSFFDFDGDDPGPAETPEPVTDSAVKLDPDGKTARAQGFDGLYARVALVLDNNGVSGLYVTQASINTDGTIVIPSFMVPGLTVKGINIALVPTLTDISSPQPNVKATDFKML